MSIPDATKRELESTLNSLGIKESTQTQVLSAVTEVLEKRSPKDKAREKRDYEIQHSPYYIGDPDLYREILYMIRQYPAYRELLEDYEDGLPAGVMIGVSGGSPGNPTERAALKNIMEERTVIKFRCRCVERALSKLPREFRQGVYDHVIWRIKYGDPRYDRASYNTWKRWTQRFIYYVAVEAGFKPIIDALKRV